MPKSVYYFYYKILTSYVKALSRGGVYNFRLVCMHDNFGKPSRNVKLRSAITLVLLNIHKVCVGVSGSSSYMKVIGSELRSQEPESRAFSYPGNLVPHFPVVSVGLWFIWSVIGPSFSSPALSVDLFLVASAVLNAGWRVTCTHCRIYFC